jgi:hypothetical protein
MNSDLAHRPIALLHQSQLRALVPVECFLSTLEGFGVFHDPRMPSAGTDHEDSGVGRYRLSQARPSLSLPSRPYTSGPTTRKSFSLT